MIAYKGFSPDLTSVMGDGKKENCAFRAGETKTVPECKTVRSGFHCCENPFECLAYYKFDGKNRFFRVEAAGDIDEDGTHRIACTQITLLQELNQRELAFYGMMYMVSHPDRKDWVQNYQTVVVQKDTAKARDKNSIAIARGSSPRVKGPEGSYLGLIVEDETGIVNAKLLQADRQKADRWLRLREDREVEICEKETD